IGFDLDCEANGILPWVMENYFARTISPSFAKKEGVLIVGEIENSRGVRDGIGFLGVDDLEREFLDVSGIVELEGMLDRFASRQWGERRERHRRFFDSDAENKRSSRAEQGEQVDADDLLIWQRIIYGRFEKAQRAGELIGFIGRY